MTVKRTGNNITYKFDGKIIVTNNYFYCDFRTIINHWWCTNPDIWVRIDGVDDELGNCVWAKGDD